MSINRNREFVTSDIILATFLKTRNVTLIKIIPLDNNHSQFVFAPVPDDLLGEWLHKIPQANVRDTVSNYRHLIRDARVLQQEGDTPNG